MAVPEGKRYSPFDADEVHADMRVDPVTTRRNMLAQPSVLEAHQGCQVCAELEPRDAVPSRLRKVRLSMQNLADALGLPPGCRPLRMYVTNDPQLLCMVVESDDFEPIPADTAAPYLEF